MTLAEYFEIFAVYLLGSIAYIVVVVIGIVISLRRWQQHPKVSKWAIIGFTLLLQNTLFGIVCQIWLYATPPRDWTISQVGTFGFYYELAQQILVVIGYAYLIAAIFGYRNIYNSEQVKPAL